MTQAVVFNTTQEPLTVSAAGHSIGGGEWGAVDLDEPKAQKHLSSGALTEVEKPEGEPVQPGAVEALKAVEEPPFVPLEANDDDDIDNGVVDEDDEQDKVEAPKPTAPKKTAAPKSTSTK